MKTGKWKDVGENEADLVFEKKHKRFFGDPIDAGDDGVIDGSAMCGSFECRCGRKISVGIHEKEKNSMVWAFVEGG